MRFFVGLMSVVLLAWTPVFLGQSSQSELEVRLLHQQIYLRGLWESDSLRFDAAGKIAEASGTTSPMLSGVDIEKVELTSGHLRLTGKRMGVVYPEKQPAWADLKQRLKIEIAAPANGDYGPALEAIFSPDLAGLAPAAPEFWQKFLLNGMPKPEKPHVTEPPLRKVGGGVAPPLVLYAPEPQFSSSARSLKISGNVLVYLHVDADGLPSHLRIVRPLGVGLDEEAIKAVEKYRFRPAMDGGTPVPIEMNVEVNFQIF
jgi:TonB family protein